MLCWHCRHIFQKNGELCIKACQLVLKTTKTTYLLHEHDKVTGNILTVRASALIHWFPIQTCCAQSTIIVITMQCWKRETS